MHRIFLLAPLALMGCVIDMPGPSDPDLTESCGAAGLQALIGQPESAVTALALPGPVRVIRPGMPVTMDYNPARLNVDVNDRGTIVAVRCG